MKKVLTPNAGTAARGTHPPSGWVDAGLRYQDHGPAFATAPVAHGTPVPGQAAHRGPLPARDCDVCEGARSC